MRQCELPVPARSSRYDQAAASRPSPNRASPSAVTVRLTALAGVSGRAIDDDDAPLADAVLQLNYIRDAAKELELFASAERPAVKTGSQGRFALGNIVPGERIDCGFSGGR